MGPLVFLRKRVCLARPFILGCRFTKVRCPGLWGTCFSSVRLSNCVVVFFAETSPPRNSGKLTNTHTHPSRAEALSNYERPPLTSLRPTNAKQAYQFKNAYLSLAASSSLFRSPTNRVTELDSGCCFCRQLFRKSMASGLKGALSIKNCE